MNPNITIREILLSEIYKLKDMLYEAIYQPDEKDLIPRNVLEIPEVNAYIKDFGKRADDYCLVANLDGKIIGAVWVRVISDQIKGYGHVDAQTPEFAISLYKQYRNQGIGTRLMTHMIDYLRKVGYKQASLSVQKENYAVQLYFKMGFSIVKEDNEDYLMILNLNL
ncbi:GNAT family N-acetyltransferase [Dysgonomonas sp. Marseille-P4677]|uniref:GNAT family N-acetyltransferase n=1 Tax=Dysgonomonas sp. Marseille-P4677 TaxID=2364790 RepID=UPI001911C637|nr:GNAT family N-acetyltransferase [Dysgonomonas sp. Marseille-P4677]MBK5720745.1 GNAT family N-acetyltransferase [Dysgonomonas sp. Marseille-P4677]